MMKKSWDSTKLFEQHRDKFYEWFNESRCSQYDDDCDYLKERFMDYMREHNIKIFKENEVDIQYENDCRIIVYVKFNYQLDNEGYLEARFSEKGRYIEQRYSYIHSEAWDYVIVEDEDITIEEVIHFLCDSEVDDVRFMKIASSVREFNEVRDLIEDWRDKARKIVDDMNTPSKEDWEVYKENCIDDK